MSERHFIVYLRDSAWQYSYRGSVTAPFKTREDAIQSAIAEAEEENDPEIEVIVQDADMRTETVWRPGNA